MLYVTPKTGAGPWAPLSLLRIDIYTIKATNTRLDTVAEIRLGQMLFVREAAHPPIIPTASQV